MKKKSYRKAVLWLAAIALFSLLILWLFSPYGGWQKGKITSEVLIEVPCEDVYRYLGNSDHASDWSVYVSFIETINSDVVQDGLLGSKRVCYTSADKSGFNWEEEILALRENEYRKLSCYNFDNLEFPAPNLETEQIYTAENNGCLLAFTLDFQEDPSFIDLLKIKYGGYRIQKIFDGNLQNIRKEVLEKTTQNER